MRRHQERSPDSRTESLPRGREFLVAERAVGRFPFGYDVSQAASREATAGCVGKPRRGVLGISFGRIPYRFGQFTLERNSHSFNSHVRIILVHTTFGATHQSRVAPLAYRWNHFIQKAREFRLYDGLATPLTGKVPRPDPMRRPKMTTDSQPTDGESTEATEDGNTAPEAKRTGPPPERLHWIQVKLAFGNEGKEPARPARLIEVDEAHVRVHYLGGAEEALEVVEPARLADLLGRDDVCRHQGQPLLLVSTCYRVLGVATGPPTPPSQLRASLAFAFENETVTHVLPAGDDQPTFHTLALALTRHRTEEDVTP